MANGGVRFQSPIALRHSPDEEVVVLGRSGNDLLSRVLRHSTIGAEEFNGRVRDGIGFLAPRSNHRTGQGQRQARPQGSVLGHDPGSPSGRREKGEGSKEKGIVPSPFTLLPFAGLSRTSITRAIKLNRAISTSQLNASPRLHIWP